MRTSRNNYYEIKLQIPRLILGWKMSFPEEERTNPVSTVGLFIRLNWSRHTRSFRLKGLKHRSLSPKLIHGIRKAKVAIGMRRNVQ